MDSDDDREETAAWKGVPGTIVLINVIDKSTASVAHIATSRMVRQYLRLSNSQLIGVCLYGTEDSKVSTLGTKSIIDVIPLNAPTVEDYKRLRDIDVSSYAVPKEFEMSEALRQCSKMFTNCKKQLLSRNVIILSKLDIAPVESDQKPTLKRVRDLVDLNVDIKLVNIAHEEYKIHNFYAKFICEANKGRDTELPKEISDAKEIERIMHHQSHRHLAVAGLSFEIGEGLAVGVAVYSLLSTQNFTQKKANLDRETNAIVSTVTKTVKIMEETSTDGAAMEVDKVANSSKEMPLLKSELLHYQIFGNERVEFTDNEMKVLKNPFGPPKMKLLGFKPASMMCKEKWFFKCGYFLFPNENIIEGSTVAFRALYQACVETSVVAISVLCTRVNAKPSIVALSPCTHPLGLDVEIGFDVIHIPFVENVRDIPALDEEEDMEITEEQKMFMKDMLKHLQFDYRPDMFENPKLQCEYRAIEAIALEEDDLEPFIDSTKPLPDKFEIIKADKFEELFGPFDVTAPKRSATKELGETRGGKKAKLELDEEAVEILKHRIETSTVKKFTVPELRGILLSIGDPNIPALSGLKKEQLVDLVYKHYKI